jgi:hypothetical protein
MTLKAKLRAPLTRLASLATLPFGEREEEAKKRRALLGLSEACIEEPVSLALTEHGAVW